MGRWRLTSLYSVAVALKKIPSTNAHKLSAERVAKVAKALVRRLVERGILPPPQKGIVPLPKEQSAKLSEGSELTGYIMPRSGGCITFKVRDDKKD